MNIIFLLLSLFDIVSGIFYLLCFNFPLFYLILFIKGVWSVVSCFLAKEYFFTIFGFIDTIVGIFGFFSIFRIDIFGIALILKGLYSIIFSF
ncbi:MAG: hypothetical protein QXW01_02825 [Candidatus Aenigmatarchaeota archaeon]